MERDRSPLLVLPRQTRGPMGEKRASLNEPARGRKGGSYHYPAYQSAAAQACRSEETELVGVWSTENGTSMKCQYLC
jgi:hypothetical protein